MLFAGLISGTSRDGIDAVLVDFGSHDLSIVAAATHRYPPELQAALASLVEAPDKTSLASVGELHAWIGEVFAEAAEALIEDSGIRPNEIIAIGSHGQTIHHGPDAQHAYSLQIGDAARIARRTGIPTVADFRSADIAAGGQGAPLVPAFHDWLFRRCHEARIVLNIGGIANITVLHADDRPTIGFDTGPGNTLLDAWIRECRGLDYDEVLADRGRGEAGDRDHRAWQ